MVQLTSILTASLTLLATAAAAADSNVKVLDPTNFDKNVYGGKPSLVEFYAPWCGHCKTLAPVYEQLADSLVGSPVTIAKVDGDEHKQLGLDFGVTGFPMIKYFDGKTKEPVDYTGKRDLESLQNFITEQSGAKAKKILSAPSEVELLTDKTFHNVVGQDKDVLVAFTAPWCGHCKTLAPVWEKVAHDFASDSEVVIAKVDAEANAKLASEFSITGYPSIRFFPKGSSEPEDYPGNRDEAAFVKYVNEKAGTHRVAGGSLDLTAGTIAALDSIISKATGGGDLATIVEEAKNAASGLKDKYAEYYLKVLDKIGQNAGYVQKESSRLESLLKKGGLAREKQDDFKSRLNILQKFGLTNEKSEL